MKKIDNKLKKKIPIKALAEQFKHELDSKYSVHILPNGDTVYKNFVIRKNQFENYSLINFKNQTVINQFFLKSCAVMAAKAYHNIQIEKFFEIKQLDNKYWANHVDAQVFRQNIKHAVDLDRYLILLTRLEDATSKEQYYENKITSMFKCSFV
mgnify:CR=1 FL=1